MNDIFQLVQSPALGTLIKIFAIYWFFSAIVGAMPTPTQDANPFYQFLFRFLHILAGNINRAAVAFKVPGSQTEQPQETAKL